MIRSDFGSALVSGAQKSGALELVADLLVIVGDATHSVPWSVPTVNQHSVSFGCCLVVFVLQNLFLTLSDS